MRARIVPASRGAGWLLDGWQMFRAAPLGWLALSFVYLFGTQVVALVPVLGVVVVLVAVPGLSVGLMGAARAASRGGVVGVEMLFDGFRAGWREQLILGVVYLACSLAVFLLAAPSGALEPADLPGAAALLALVYTPVMMAFWFSPALAAWHSVAPAKALFFSFVACLVNWRAFLAYGAVLAFVVIGVPLALLSLPVVAFGAPSEKLAPALLVLLALLLPVLFASFYASYRDVFGTAGAG